MKTSIYSLIITGLLFTSLESTSKVISEDTISGKSMNVPAAPAVNFLEDYEAPLNLLNIKAKNGMVPLAPFTLGLSNELEITKGSNVPVPEIKLTSEESDLPAGLNIKVRFINVPLAPFEMGDPMIEILTGL